MKKSLARIKWKLLFIICQVFLLSAVIVVGVFAAQKADVELNGTITFEANQVYAKVTGSVSGAQENPTYQTLNYSFNSTPSSTALDSWNNNLNFQNTANNIEISMTIENLSTERSLIVTATDLSSTTPNLTRTISLASKTLPPSTGSGTSKVTIKFTLSVTSQSAQVDTNYHFRVVLTDQNATT